ncbi:MAG: hypothetical protein ACOYOH_00265 [Paracraurococcus sp.]
MLGELERALCDLILARQAGADAAGLAGAEIVPGPGLAPPKRRRLLVRAGTLVREAPATGEEARPAGTANRYWPLAVTLDPAVPRGPAVPRPGDAGGPPAGMTQVEEVQVPPGRLAAHGDDYVFDAGSGRLGFSDAAATGPGVVLLRDPAPLPGLRDLAPATLRLDLVAEAPTLAEADAMLGLALDAGFAGLALRQVVTLAMFPPGGLRLRLRGIVPALEALACGTLAVGAGLWAQSSATLRLHGELETLVTLPVPPAQKGVIREVDISAAVKRDGA